MRNCLGGKWAAQQGSILAGRGGRRCSVPHHSLTEPIAENQRSPVTDRNRRETNLRKHNGDGCMRSRRDHVTDYHCPEASAYNAFFDNDVSSYSPSWPQYAEANSSVSVASSIPSARLGSTTVPQSVGAHQSHEKVKVHRRIPLRSHHGRCRRRPRHACVECSRALT